MRAYTRMIPILRCILPMPLFQFLVINMHMQHQSILTRNGVTCFASHKQMETDVLFIDSTMLITKNLTSLLTRNAMSCVPPATSEAAICGMTVLHAQSVSGTALYSFLNATLQEPWTPEAAFHAAVSKLYPSLSLLQWPIVFATVQWWKVDVFPVMIEFDGSQNRINNRNCSVQIFIEWHLFNTVNIITEAVQPLLENDANVAYLAGCASAPFAAAEPILGPRHYDFPKVIDSVLFYDEISMLLLRLQYLEHAVDFHIVIEARTTFTGRPKPLHFKENYALFAAYHHRIVHLIIDEYVIPAPNSSNEVFFNEYYSRNAALSALDMIGHSNDRDILLIADTDEIPHVNAIATLRNLFSDTSSDAANRIYKLFVDSYLYNFDCFVSDTSLHGTPLTATSIRLGRKLAEAHPIYGADRFPTYARLHLQHQQPIPYEHMNT